MKQSEKSTETETIPVFLSSYPRSGNTYLRTVLNYCFGLKSGSVYPNDLGGRATLEKHVGHIEHENGKLIFKNQIPLIKTHQLKSREVRSIYVLRDARQASLSLYKFLKRNISIEDVILGRHVFGTWAAHVQSWETGFSTNTLLLTYEGLTSDFVGSLKVISDYLAIKPISTE